MLENEVWLCFNNSLFCKIIKKKRKLAFILLHQNFTNNKYTIILLSGIMYDIKFLLVK